MNITGLHNENCLEFMGRMSDKSVGLVLTDPPYGVGLSYDTYDDSEANWYKMFSQLIPTIKRVSTMAILPCCRIKALPWIYQNYPPDWLICWYKGSPGHRSFVGFNDWEPLLVYGKNKGVQMHDYFKQGNTEKMGNYGHPCPKSESWVEWLLTRALKDKNGIVFDPFMGSGTTAVVAERLGYVWGGCEISPAYCDVIRRRVASADPDLDGLV